MNQKRASAVLRPCPGFSLLEMMIALTIAAVLAAVALPAFGDMLRNSRRTTAVNALVSSLFLARTESIKRGRPVTLCGIVRPGDAQCAGTADWSGGWMVFADGDGDGIPDAGVPRLAEFHIDGDVRVTASLSRVNPLPIGAAVLRPFGYGNTNGTFTVCDRRGARQARAVIVAANGRARVSDRKADGSALACP